jgi:putative addiction module component (TIGR02574 family)
MIGTLEVEQMSRTEKLQAMELLWRSLSAEPDKLQSPAWHKKILAKRLAKIESGKAQFLTVAQLKKRLAKRASWEASSSSLRPLKISRRRGIFTTSNSRELVITVLTRSWPTLKASRFIMASIHGNSDFTACFRSGFRLEFITAKQNRKHKS